MGIKEQTLLNSMNGMISKEIEEKEKERERGERGEMRGERTPSASENPQDISLTSHLSPFTSNLSPLTSKLERLLIQSVIRDGEKVIFEDIEAEDGQSINLTVAQYIAYDLGQDGLSFHDDRYNQILSEAAAHSGEEGFCAEEYFMHHPDIAISSLAAELAIDRHQLTPGFQPKEREGGLRQRVLHLVLDLRMDIIEKRLKEIQTQLKAVGSDVDRMKQLLEEFRDTQQIRDALARQLGNDVIR
jgi:DNA primase